VAFHLNEALGQTATLKIGNSTLEQKVPLEHKFMMTPLGTQDVFILRQAEEAGHGIANLIILIHFDFFSFSKRKLLIWFY
jgi:hypothetical protein